MVVFHIGVKEEEAQHHGKCSVEEEEKEVKLQRHVKVNDWLREHLFYQVDCYLWS